jgi:uncharacterized protein (TIGR03083 family)
MGVSGVRARDVIEAESQRLADVLETTVAGARCPTCPEWTAADLLWHIAEVQHFWAEVLARNVRAEADVAAVEQSKPARPETMDELLAVRARSTAALLAQLDVLDDEQLRWSWWPADQTVGFTRRMQTYEATMHRVDAELTAGLPIGEITTEVAVGAVDHVVDVMWGWLPDWGRYEPQAVIELVATDEPRSWLVEVGHWTGTGPRTGAAVDEPRAVRAHTGSPSATIAAPAQDLALWAWTRGGMVERSGSTAALAAVDVLVAHGMQ